MKKLDGIPRHFEELDENNLLVDSESITERYLKNIDKVLKPFGLEVVWFENGAAYNFYIAKI